MTHRGSTALALALALLCGGCSTTDRLWRISPLSSESTRSPDRVNLWPLAYHDGRGTSVLWPLFDIDEKGFALRPVLSKDETRWNVLWPFASWDTAKGEGWVFPYYDLDGNRGVLVLANIGTSSWVGPVWWTRVESGDVEARGIFPVAWWLPDVRVVGPAWWSRDSSSWGLFPLFGRDLSGMNHVGLAWWLDDEDTYGLLPLFYHADEGRQLAVVPFYAHDLGDDHATRSYLLGLARTHRTKSLRRDWAFPFWYDSEEADEKDRILLPIFYRRERGDEAHVFTALGDRRVAPDGSSFNLYPLWWASESEESSWNTLLPLYYYADRLGERTLITPLGGRGWSASGRTRYTNVLGPLFHYSRNETGSESRTAFLWPLFERHRQVEDTTTRALPLFTHSSSPERSETWFALGLAHRSRAEEASAWRLSPLAAVSRSSAEDGDVPSLLYHLSAYGNHAHRGRTDHYLFPLFRRTTGTDSSSTSLLLDIGYHEREGDARRWHLWPLVGWSYGYDWPGIEHDLTLIGRSRSEHRSSFHIGGPLLYATSEQDDGFRRHSSTQLLTFFSKRGEEFHRDYVPLQIAPSRGDRVSSRRMDFLLGLWWDEQSRTKRWREGVVDEDQAIELRRWSRGPKGLPAPSEMRDAEAARAILAQHDAPPASTSDSALSERVRAFAAEHTELLDHRDGGIPFLYGYERSPTEREWYGPLWLLHHKSDEKKERTAFLYYGYRSETEGDRTSRDIFPFITWDTAKDGEERTVSFLWRLFRYERRGDTRGGHLLFIPWGEAGS